MFQETVVEGVVLVASISMAEIPDEIMQRLGVVQQITFPRQGHTSDVGIIRSEQGNFVLKRTKGELYSAWLAEEVQVLNLLSMTGIPFPKVFQFVEQTSTNQAWALIELRVGETIRYTLSNEKNKARKHEILYKFGAILSQIHKTPCPQALIREEQWLDEMLRRAEIHLHKYSVDGTAELLQSLRHNKPEPVENTLIHGDFTIDNVLVHNGDISGVIDWSGGAFGDPRYDVSLAIRPKPNIFEEAAEFQTFFEGYGRRNLGEREYAYFANGLNEFF